MENNLLYCFTGTGNSLQISKEIQSSLENCKIEPIGKEASSPNKYNRIGFVFPIYYWGLPVQVEQFITNLNLSQNKDTYFFAIATCGEKVGNAFSTIQDLLSEKGVDLHYSEKIIMPDNYILLYETKNESAASKEQYETHIKSINENIINQNRTTVEKKKISSYLIHKFAIKRFSNTANKFNINGCIGCGICEKVCPAKNITMNEGKPKFSQQCEQCTACIQYCPKNAINYKKSTQSRKRYKNPYISLSERQKFYNK